MNAIANMYGPTFLALYAAVGVGLLFLIMGWNRMATRGSATPTSLPPNDNDPYRVAFLRGSENELIRLAVYRLLANGYLLPAGQATSPLTHAGVSIPTSSTRKHVPSLPDNGRIVAASPFPRDPYALPPVEQAVLNRLRTPRKPNELFFDAGLKTALKPTGARYTAELESAGLLTSAEVRIAAQKRLLYGLALTLALGGYKFAVALAKGKHNVGFLVLLSIVFIIAFLIAANIRRRTETGERWLADLRSRYISLQKPAAFAAADPELAAFGVALFGMTVLAGTPQQPITAYFPQASASGGCGSSSSSSCSSSSCGGSSCGSSGCGGGGCGGCGGS